MISPAYLVARLIGLYQTLIIVYAIMSWFAPSSGGTLLTIYRFLERICEPFVRLFRRILPASLVGGAGFDFSPLVAILVLSLLQRLVYMIL